MIICILRFCNFISAILYSCLSHLTVYAGWQKQPIVKLDEIICLCSNMSILQVVKNVLSMSEKEISKQNNMEKFEMREQNKNKTEAKWKYKVRIFQPTSFSHGFVN